MTLTPEAILASVERYYTGKVREHGPTHYGVDWSSAESQLLRFEQLLKIVEPNGPFSINDYGCGYGALVETLEQRGWSYRYRGFDISADMLAQARGLNTRRPHCSFVGDETELPPADYTVASGILNVKLDVSDEDWKDYVLGVLRALDAVSLRGFAFNALTLYSDPERRRRELYYADPLFFFDHCKRTFSRQVALLHDYGLWEFTMLVRK